MFKKSITLSQDELSAIIAGAIAQAMASQKPQTEKPKASKKAKADKPQKPKAEFKQMTDSDGLAYKSVVATGYLPHAVYAWNKAKAEELGGKVSKSSEGFFKADFVSVKKASQFAKVASYDIPKDAYESIKAERSAKAEQYKASKEAKSVDNKALAAELRAHGITPNGEAWEYAKAHGAKAAVKKYGK